MKLATKLAIALVLCATTASALGTTYSSGTIKHALQGNISKSQSLETKHAMDKIDRFLYERTIDLQIMDERGQIIEYLQKPGSKSQADTNRLLSQFIDFRITTGVWGDMSLLNADGKIQLSTEEATEIASLIAQDEFKETFNTAKDGQVTYSDVFLKTDSDIPIVMVISPVRSESSGRPIIGFVLGELAWSTVLQILVQPGDNVTAHLINKDSYILGTSDGSQDKEEILVDKLTDTSVLKAAQASTGDGTHSNIFPSIDNPDVEMLSTYEQERGYLSYKGNGWYMIFETPTSVAFAPAALLARNLIISSAIITALTLISIMWYSYHSVIRPVRALRSAMFRIISGDRDSRVTIDSRDEIGELGQAFNKMSEGLAVTERRLHEEQARLTASINSLEVGFFMTDLNDKIVTINSSARSLLTVAGLPPNTEWTYENVAVLLASSVDLSAVVNSCKQTGHVLKIKEINFNNKVLQMFAGPILSRTEDDQTAVIGTVVLLEDITEAIVLARSKDEFFSIASHELRTPLTSIRGNSSMILQLYADIITDPSLKEMIDDIHSSSTRLIEIVNDFLDVSRIEQGKMKFTFAEVKLDAIIEKIVYEMKAVLREKHLSLDIGHKTLDVLPTVFADKDRVQQVVYNLIGNAVKFTEKGGVKVSMVQEEKMVKVIITDTGRGVPPEGQKMLFRKFQQAGNSLLTRDTTKGTGLGLYISKLLVEGMGGQIALEGSEVGKGTSFSFTLPIATHDKVTDTLAKASLQLGHIDIDTGLTPNS